VKAGEEGYAKGEKGREKWSIVQPSRLQKKTNKEMFPSGRKRGTNSGGRGKSSR